MIEVLACRCHNSEPLARKTLKDAHYEKWQTQPVIKGKEACLNRVGSLTKSTVSDALYEYIKRSSSWSVILGIDGDKIEWADVGHGHLVDKLDAERIVEEYGN